MLVQSVIRFTRAYVIRQSVCHFVHALDYSLGQVYVPSHSKTTIRLLYSNNYRPNVRRTTAYLAISAGVCPLESIMLGLPPLAIRSSNCKACPARAATCKGVVPFSYKFTYYTFHFYDEITYYLYSDIPCKNNSD